MFSKSGFVSVIVAFFFFFCVAPEAVAEEETTDYPYGESVTWNDCPGLLALNGKAGYSVESYNPGAYWTLGVDLCITGRKDANGFSRLSAQFERRLDLAEQPFIFDLGFAVPLLPDVDAGGSLQYTHGAGEYSGSFFGLFLAADYHPWYDPREWSLLGGVNFTLQVGGRNILGAGYVFDTKVSQLFAGLFIGYRVSIF